MGGSPKHTIEVKMIPQNASVRYTWERAISTSQMSSNAKLLCLTMATHINRQGGGAFPSQNTLSELCSMSVRQVQRAVAEARDAGLIVVERRISESGLKLGNIYHPCFPSTTPASEAADTGGASKRREGRVVPDTGGGSLTDKGTDNNNKVFSDEFGGWWETKWRRAIKRPNDSKAGALRAYIARRKEGVTAEEINEGTARYTKYVIREGVEMRYTKQAKTFLGPDRHYESDYGDTENEEQDQWIFSDSD